MNAMIQAGKTILNALAFANVSNLGEFRAMLRQIEQPSASGHEQAPHGMVSAVSDSPAVAHGIQHARGAL